MLIAVRVSSAPAAPIDFTQHLVRLSFLNSHEELVLRTDADAYSRNVYDQNLFTGFYVDGNKYPIQTAFSETFLPLESTEWSDDGTRFTYHYARGGTWTITDLHITDLDGSTHVGSWRATLGKIDIVTTKGSRGGATLIDFFDGEFDPVTAALLGLPSNDIFGELRWFHNWHDNNVGAPERTGHPDGEADFQVPEPSLVALLGVGLIAARRSRHRLTARFAATKTGRRFLQFS